MNCFVHERVAAVGLCAVCQKAVCRDCVGRDTPRVICRTCIERRATVGYEYRSSLAIGGWPLLHVCAGFDPVTMRPRVAKGVVAIGNMAIGVVAIAGLSCGLLAVGGLSIGHSVGAGAVSHRRHALRRQHGRVGAPMARVGDAAAAVPLAV
jgi:hypothetical protein